MDTLYKHPSVQIAEVMGLIYRSGLTTTSGGNISMLGDHGNIWITPAAVDKGSLTRANIVKVEPGGEVYGLHRPSSELPFHQAIYAQRPDLGAIIHAHPPALVAFSIVRKIPDTRVIPQAVHLCGAVGYAPNELPGSEALGKSIARAFAEGHNAVIMENHGTVVGGRDLNEAFQRFETLEFCAMTIIRAHQLGSPVYLRQDQVDAFERQSMDLEEFEHPVPGAEERMLRHQIVDFIGRACTQGLMIGSHGTISARLRGEDFLINPTGFDRRNVDLSDLVLVRGQTRAMGRRPSRAVLLHREIYRRHPEIGCVISTQSPHATAFAVAGVPMDTRTIPESYILLEDIPLLDFGSQLGKGEAVAEALGRHTPIVLLRNDSILVTGASILETFDRLEVAEFSATSLIESRSLGDLSPIGKQELEQLRKKFLNG
jgi:L-fuculose-phosphate aldolase